VLSAGGWHDAGRLAGGGQGKTLGVLGATREARACEAKQADVYRLQLLGRIDA
jgi:hypothetical protein